MGMAGANLGLETVLSRDFSRADCSIPPDLMTGFVSRISGMPLLEVTNTIESGEYYEWLMLKHSIACSAWLCIALRYSRGCWWQNIFVFVL